MLDVSPQIFSSLLTHLTVLQMAIAQHHSLSLRELLVLGVLATQGNIPFKELSAALSIPKSALTGLIDRLQAHGIVERRQSEWDRRCWLVTLTPSGRHLTQAIQGEEDRLMQPALDGLSETEQEAFLKAIQALNSELEGVRPRRELASEGRTPKLGNLQKGDG
jgi:DNA-binding MarR family transcriptional regulator